MNKKWITRILGFVLFSLTFIVLFFMLKDSWRDILKSITDLPVNYKLAIGVLGILPILLEGKIISVLVSSIQPFKYSNGVRTSLSGWFFRGATFGTGTQVGQIYFMNKKKVNISTAMSVMTLLYVLQKISIGLLGLIAFIVFKSDINMLYKDKTHLILISIFLAGVISFFLLLILLSEKFHGLVYRILIFAVPEKYHDKVEKVKDTMDKLKDDSLRLLKNRKIIFISITMQCLKVFVWYSIPMVLAIGSGWVAPGNSFKLVFISAISNSIVGVIPSFGGTMTTEVLFSLMLSPFLGDARAKASMIVYRFMTYYYPFLIAVIYKLAELINDKKIKKIKQ